MLLKNIFRISSQCIPFALHTMNFVHSNVRGLFGESLSLSLSMSLPLPRGTPSSIFSNPTAVPTISVLPTFTTTPISSPVSNPTVNDTITDSTVASDEDIDTSATGNVTSPIDTPKRSKNIAMIVVGSCALVAFVAMIAKKLTSPPSKGSSPLQLLPKGSSTAATATASIHDSSSNDVSSVGSSSVSGTSHANHDVQF